METTEEGKAEKILKDFGKRLDQFHVELKEAGTRVEADLRKKYGELRTSGEKLKNEASDSARWKEVEVALKKAGEELENAVKAAFRKKT
ncbi:MAG: hypothetical protein SH819_10745 [Cytophagales bacterium]|nr:hypothetical protein [Cytophagales bacterium]